MHEYDRRLEEQVKQAKADMLNELEKQINVSISIFLLIPSRARNDGRALVTRWQPYRITDLKTESILFAQNFYCIS